MGFQKIGLGGVLSFATRNAEQNMGRMTRKFGFLRGATSRTATETTRLSGTYRDAAGRMRDANGRFLSGGKSADTYSGKLGRLRGSFSALGTASGMSMTQLAAGAMMLGSVMGGLGRKVTDIVGKYNDFNKQMSVVRSVAGDISDNQFQQLRQQAIKLGSATAFTATEAAEGLENLARAGFSVEEAIGASRATLDLAAADSMGLAEAAGITANVIRALGLSAQNDSQRVADVLAKASASANTNVSELGESFKMGAATMALFGISLEEGTAVLAKLADSGLKGGLAGTSFTNMMNKLVRPTSKAAAFMKKMNIEITDANGNMRKVTSIVQDVGNALNSIPDKGDRVAMAMELTGLRGVKAVNGLMQALKGDGLAKLERDLMAANGAAKKMADERLNNMAGQITILESATEGFTIRLFDLFKGMDGSMIRPIVDGMTRLNEAWDAVASALDEGMFEAKRAELDRKHGATMIAIVLGIRDGVKTLQDSVQAIGDFFGRLAERTKGAFGPDIVQKIVQVGVVIAGVATVIGVVIGSLGMLTIAAGAVMILLQTIGSGIAAAFLPLVTIGLVLAGVFMLLRNEGESVGETLTRIWTSVKDAALDLWHNGIKPVWEGIRDGWSEAWGTVGPNIMSSIAELKATFVRLGLSISDLWNRMTEGSDRIDWAGIGAFAANALGEIVSGLTTAVGLIVEVATVIIDTLIPVFEAIKSAAVWLWTTILQPFLAGLYQGWVSVWPILRLVALEVFDAIKMLIGTVVEVWNDLTSGISGGAIDWQHWGEVAVQVIGWVLTFALKLVKWAIHAVRIVIEVVVNVVQLVVGYLKVVWEFVKRSIHFVTELFGGLIEAFKMIAGGDVLGAFKTAGLAILNFLLSPIRLIVGAVADLVDKLLGLRAIKKLLPEEQIKNMREFTSGLRQFADKGITLGAEGVAGGGGGKGGSILDASAFSYGAALVEKSAQESKLAAKSESKDEGALDLDFGDFQVPSFAQELGQLKTEEARMAADSDAEKSAASEKLATEVADKTAAAVREGLEDTTLETTVNTTACVDGKEVSRSQAKQSQRLADRLGATTPPFVRRTSAEQGMIPSQ